MTAERTEPMGVNVAGLEVANRDVTLRRAAELGLGLQTVRIAGLVVATCYAGRSDGYVIELGSRVTDALPGDWWWRA